MLLFLSCVAVVTGLVVFVIVSPLWLGCRGRIWQSRGRLAGVLLFGIPIMALSVYFMSGEPALLDRWFGSGGDYSLLEQVIARVETELRLNPENGEGWARLAEAYSLAGMFSEAVMAARRAISLIGSSIDTELLLGETLVNAAGGIITVEAQEAFNRVLRLDPDNIPAKVYMALVLSQDGRKSAAIVALRELFEDPELKKIADWTKLIENEINKLENKIAQ